MKSEWIKSVSLALTFVVGLSSCGNTNLAEGGIGGTGISMGTVTQIGSIWVNGVEYDTTGATIILPDEGRQYSDSTGLAGGDTLRPGMVVTVRGSVNPDGVTGKADSVTYADSLEGPIDAVANANTLEVLGQRIIIDNLTLDEFGNPWNDTSAFTPGEVVEVSGFVNARGDIRATYVVKKTGSTTRELKGVVGSVTTPWTFSIGGLTVDTTSIGLDVSTYQGQFVEAKGIYAAGVLYASSVEVGSAVLDTTDHNEAQMEAIVTSVSPAPAMEFVLGGQTVRYSAGTAFNGGLATDIVPGVRMEVEGSLSGGIFDATAITFEDSIELEANILAADALTNTITLDGLVNAQGANLTVKVDDVLTEFEGVTGFADLAVGNHVALRARDIGTGLLATKLSASSIGDPAIVLQGPLQDASQTGNAVTVLGVTVSGFSEYDIDTLGTVDAATFFGTVIPGDLVSVDGNWDGVTLVGNKIELDN